jgi:hypothetical protein
VAWNVDIDALEVVLTGTADADAIVHAFLAQPDRASAAAAGPGRLTPDVSLDAADTMGEQEVNISRWAGPDM